MNRSGGLNNILFRETNVAKTVLGTLFIFHAISFLYQYFYSSFYGNGTLKVYSKKTFGHLVSTLLSILSNVTNIVDEVVLRHM